MKKISLKNLNLKEVDLLSREQLKNVLGGFTGGSGIGGGTATTSDEEKCNCNNSDQCSGDTPECAADCDSSGTGYYGHCVAKQTVG